MREFRVIESHEMPLDEIVLPNTKPETEWVRGRALRKMSPRRNHARLQLVLGATLDRWARGREEVGTEWRFRVPVPGGPLRPLVPDIAYVANERLAPLSDRDLEIPALAPDVAVEVLSPGDDPRDIASKVRDYLDAGSSLVVIVDPATRTFVLHEPDGERLLSHDDAFESAALPGFTPNVGAIFAEALDRA